MQPSNLPPSLKFRGVRIRLKTRTCRKDLRAFMNLSDIPLKSHWRSVRSGLMVEIIRSNERSQSVLVKYQSGAMRWYSILVFRKIFDRNAE